MRVISLLILLFVSAFAQDDVLKTRRGGVVEAPGFLLSQPLSEIGSSNMPAWKVHADSALVDFIVGIYARMDSMQLQLARVDTAVFGYSEPLAPVANLNLMPLVPQSLSHIGAPGKGYAYGNIERLESMSSHHTAELTLNAANFESLVELGEYIHRSEDSLIYVYVPAGIWELPAAPLAIYGKKEVQLEFAPNAYMMPTSDWPSTTFKVNVENDVVEGDTTLEFTTGDADFSKIKVGMAFMPRGNGSGGISGGVWQEDHYILKTLDTSTGVATFWPPFDGDPQSGNIGFTQSFGYRVNPYAPNNGDLVDTLYADDEVEFGGSSLFFAARGARLQLSGGVWTARPWRQSTVKPVGAGARAPINSVSSNGVVVRNTTVVNPYNDGIILQNSDAYIVFEGNTILFAPGAAMHIGGRGRNTMIRGNVTYKCNEGLYSSLDLERVFLIGNLFIDNQSTTDHVYSSYGDQVLLGDHLTVVAGNLFDGGLSAIDVGQQSGRLFFQQNIVMNMVADGVSVNALSDTSIGVARNAYMVDISYNQVLFSGRNGIFINNLEGGRVVGNQVYNNGTNATYAAAHRSGIRIESDSTESVIIAENFAFNLPDSGNFSSDNYNSGETIAQSQQYGFYTNATDETNTYRENHAWRNSTADFSITTALPDGSEFRNNAIPWQPGTFRLRSSDSTMHYWDKSAWRELQ